MPTDTVAAVLRAVGATPRLEQVELRDPGPGEVLVRMAAAGVCHTDVALVDGEHDSALPIVLGHEGAGTIEAVGGGTTGIGVGNRALLNLAPNCGRCLSCAAGRPILCLNWPTDGGLLTGPTPVRGEDGPIPVMAAAGCFAGHVVMPAASVIPIPERVPFDVAAVVGCAVITGFGAAVASLDIAAGSRGAVIGVGGVGASALLAARLRGPVEVVAVDPSPERRDRARALGATDAVDPDDDEALERLRTSTRSRGLDWTIVAAGQPAAVRLGVELLAAGGTAAVVGTPERAELDIRAMVGNEKTLRGSTYGSVAPTTLVPRILDLYASGRLDLDALVSHRLPLDSIEEALSLSRSASGMRVVLLPE
jgi:S-(hydroxymethyl)glutathione dehydrogenase / alcohol dehydrogenase